MTCEFERHSFGICYIDDTLVICGGYIDGKVTSICEKYNLENKSIKKIANLN